MKNTSKKPNPRACQHPESISLHLKRLIRKTGGQNGPIGRQFVADFKQENRHFDQGAIDPLVEEEHEVAPGLVYKYRGEVDSQGKILSYGRALWTVTRNCASYCRFCTRGREVGLDFEEEKSLKDSTGRNTLLSAADQKRAFTFLKKPALGTIFKTPTKYTRRILSIKFK